MIPERVTNAVWPTDDAYIKGNEYVLCTQCGREIIDEQCVNCFIFQETYPEEAEDLQDYLLNPLWRLPLVCSSGLF